MSALIYFFLLLLILYLVRKFCNGPKTSLVKDMSGKIIVITGASAGVGKETAKNLLIRGATVIFACRDEKKTQTVINSIKNKNKISSEKAIFMKLDLKSLKSVSEFAEKIKTKFSKIDILINNAGCCIEKFSKTEDGIETTFQTNHISHTVLTALLLDLLNNSSEGRVINVGSEAYRFAKYSKEFFKFDETLYEFFNSYSISKLGNLYLLYALKSYSEKNKMNIKSVCVHPGGVFTEITRPENKPWYLKLFIYLIVYPISMLTFKNEEMGAQTTLHCCYLDRENLVDGGYYQNCKLSKVKALDKILEREIYLKTYELIKKSSIYEKCSENENFKNLLEHLRKE